MSNTRSSDDGRQPPAPFWLGDWRVEPSLSCIQRRGETRRVTPKAIQVLCLLVRTPGQVWTRDELFESAWSDVEVGEEVLTRAIADLRKALSDRPGLPRYIETVPKIGYRVVAEVRPDLPFSREDDSGTLADLPAAHRRDMRSAVLVAGLMLFCAVFIPWTSSSGDDAASAPRIRPFTTLPGREAMADFSPDGLRVAFAWQGSEGDNWDIYVKRVADDGTQTMERWTDDPASDFSPTWSPDGQRLAFQRLHQGECTVWVMGPPTSDQQPRRLADCADNPYPDLDWSPAGDWLAYTDRSGEGHSYGIYLVSAETGERRLLIFPPSEHWGDKEPVFSPDGKSLAFIRSVGLGAQDLLTIPVSGGEPRRVTHQAQRLGGHCWTPDGRFLLYSSQQGGRWRIWRVPAEGGEPQWVPLDSGRPIRPQVSLNNLLVFTESHQRIDLAEIRLDDSGDPRRHLFVSTYSESLPAYSPDGNRVAFVSDRSGSTELWLGEGEQVRRLTDLGGTFSGPPQWSPDGGTILFDGRPDRNSNLYAITVSTGEIRRLTDEATNDLFPSFSRDGNWIYFGSNRGARWQVWKMPAGGGEAVQVTMDGAYAAAEALDGDLYLLKFNRAGMWKRARDTGAERPLESLSKLWWRTDWVSTSRGLFFMYADKGAVHFAELRPDESLRSILDFGFIPGNGVSVTPDGTRLLVPEHVQPPSSDLMLADLASR